MNKNIKTIVLSQIFYAIMIELIRIAMVGFNGFGREAMIKEATFVIPVTIFITAVTICMYTGVNVLIQDFKNWCKKNTNSNKVKEQQKK